MANAKQKNVETELKYSLSREDYLKLLKGLRAFPQKTATQINTYFDTPTLSLKKKRIGLRIRVTDKTKAVVTLKFPKLKSVPSPSFFKSRYEFEAPIPFALAKKILAGKTPLTQLVQEPIQVLQSKISPLLLRRLHPLGDLKTVRTTLRWKKGLILELDRFEFFGQTYYELELETEKPLEADREVKKLFSEYQIAYHPSLPSKLARFISVWKQTRN